MLAGEQKGKTMSNKKHILPAVVEVNLKTGERKVLEYVELTDKQYNEKIVQPLARILYDSMISEIKSGKFKPEEIPNANINE